MKKLSARRQDSLVFLFEVVVGYGVVRLVGGSEVQAELLALLFAVALVYERVGVLTERLDLVRADLLAR